MSSLYKRFGAAENKMKEGVWIDLDDARFKVAYASRNSNPRYSGAIERRTKPYRRKIESGMVDDTQLQKMVTAAFIETILLDWEGVKDREEREIPFSREAATKLFADLPELSDYLQKVAGDISTFQQLEEEHDLGNSKATLSGEQKTKEETPAQSMTGEGHAA